jgi:predicted esterase
VKERRIRVARTARYYSLGPSDPPPKKVWIVCHGYRQLARRFLPRFAGLNDGTRLIVAPEALSRFYLHDNELRHGKAVPIGATWMTREDRESEIEDYVGYLDAVLDEVTGDLGDEPSPGVTVLGFSQGAQTVCRWVAAGEMTIERVILWGGYLPEDFDLDRGPDRMRSATFILVRGLADPYISEEVHALQEARLEELGIPFETVTHTGGHELEASLLAEVAGRTG